MKLVISLPHLIAIRVLTRSLLLAAALSLLLNGPTPTPVPEPHPKWVDNPFLLPMLIADFKRVGLFTSDCRAIFLGDPGSRVSLLGRNRVDPVSVSGFGKQVGLVDFVLAVDEVRSERWFGLVDRVVKVGGVVVVRFGSGLESCARLPANYRVVYVRRFGSTFVGMKKVSHGRDVDGFGSEENLKIVHRMSHRITTFTYRRKSSPTNACVLEEDEVNQVEDNIRAVEPEVSAHLKA